MNKTQSFTAAVKLESKSRLSDQKRTVEEEMQVQPIDSKRKSDSAAQESIQHHKGRRFIKSHSQMEGHWSHLQGNDEEVDM